MCIKELDKSHRCNGAHIGFDLQTKTLAYRSLTARIGFKHGLGLGFVLLEGKSNYTYIPYQHKCT